MTGRRTSGSSRPSSGSSGSCRLFLHFLGKIAVRKMSGRTPGTPRRPSCRHPRPSEPQKNQGRELYGPMRGSPRLVHFFIEGFERHWSIRKNLGRFISATKSGGSTIPFPGKNPFWTKNRSSKVSPIHCVLVHGPQLYPRKWGASAGSGRMTIRRHSMESKHLFIYPRL